MSRKTINTDAAHDFDISGATSNAPATSRQRTVKTAPQPEAEPKQAAPVEDLGSLLRELTALDNIPGVDELPRREQIAHMEKRAALSRRIHALQQGPIAPVIDANAMAASRIQEARAQAGRASLIARLKKVAAGA
jgi:hypothetical protein